MGPCFNLRELCEAAGTERLTVLRWVKKGLPCIREKGTHGGHPKMIFDKEVALAWIAEHGSLTAGRKAAALQSLEKTSEKQVTNTVASSPAKPPEQPTRTIGKIDLDSAREPGLLGNLERLKAQEIATSSALLRAKQENNLSAIAVLSERHLKETNTLAKIEQVALTYRTRLGELGPRHQMQGVYEKVLNGVKNAVLGIPSSAVAHIMPYLRKPEDAGLVREILDRVSRESLRSISHGQT